jgi:hypothetical protein
LTYLNSAVNEERVRMEIKLVFDSAMLHEYDTPVRTPFFVISISHNGVFFPFENWTDFGVRILGGWIDATLELLAHGETAELDFMDGPYSILVRYLRTPGIIEMMPNNLPLVWIVPVSEFAEALLRAGDAVLHQIKESGIAHMGVGKRDRDILERGVGELRKVLAVLGPAQFDSRQGSA